VKCFAVQKSRKHERERKTGRGGAKGAEVKGTRIRGSDGKWGLPAACLGRRSEPIRRHGSRGEGSSTSGNDPTQECLKDKVQVFPGLKNYDYERGVWKWEATRQREIREVQRVLEKRWKEEDDSKHRGDIRWGQTRKEVDARMKVSLPEPQDPLQGVVAELVLEDREAQEQEEPASEEGQGGSKKTKYKRRRERTKKVKERGREE